jgi:ribokinase
MTSPRMVVAGQLARDLVLRVDDLPEAGSAADARERHELLGGKGANQAVALAQLGAAPALVAVAGDDRIGDELLDRCRQDNIDVTSVVRRPGTLTGLVVEMLEKDGRWRYVQHLPDEVLLTEADVEAADFGDAAAVLVQLQQPMPAALAAARRGRGAGALVILDGAPQDGPGRDELLATADVVRADEREARILGGTSVLGAGPWLLAFGEEGGNRFTWPGGEVFLPWAPGPVVDTTGAGDALTAALTIALLRGDKPDEAARFAVSAAASSVRRVAGRPALSALRPDRDQTDLPGGPQ